MFLIIYLTRCATEAKSVQVNFQWDDDEVRFVLDQHTELDFYSASSLKQQPAGRHVTPLGHIILGIMVSMLTLDRTKHYKIGICWFSAKYAALRSKSKDWLAQNQNDVSWVEWHVYLQTVVSVS
jgi:hypothetical protein